MSLHRRGYASDLEDGTDRRGGGARDLGDGSVRTTAGQLRVRQGRPDPDGHRDARRPCRRARRYPDLRIEVGGHTDSRGSDALNLRLSQRRAESVLEYLAQAGVSRSRLSAVGYGEARPVASNDNETGRALNRRVEFVVLNPEAARQTARPASRHRRPPPAHPRGARTGQSPRLRWLTLRFRVSCSQPLC